MSKFHTNNSIRTSFIVCNKLVDLVHIAFVFASDSYPEQGLSNILYTLLILFENILMQENTLILFFWKPILKVPQVILDNMCNDHPEQGPSNIPYTIFFWKPILKIPQAILDNTCEQTTNEYASKDIKVKSKGKIKINLLFEKAKLKTSQVFRSKLITVILRNTK
ncbi:hypothetical protein YC2023_116544 [Brassica napus]